MLVSVKKINKKQNKRNHKAKNQRKFRFTQNPEKLRNNSNFSS